MTTKRQLELGAFMRPISIHTGAWRYPGAFPDANFNLGHIKRFAQTLERGRFGALFMADHLAVLNMPAKALRRSHTVTSFEPFTLLSYLAAATEHIGLVATASTTFDAPYHIARRFASLEEPLLRLTSAPAQLVWQRRVDPAVTPELEALPAACLKVPAGVTTLGIDLTGVRLAFDAVMNAGATRPGLERKLAKMPGRQPSQDVFLIGTSPAHQVLIGDEDGTRALVTTGATRQAVELGLSRGRALAP